MYDYISIYSDENYSKKIRTETLEKYLLATLNLRKESSLKFSKEIDGVRIILTGILANENGNYAFDTLNGVEEINLIEVDVPNSIDAGIEDAITRLAVAIATEYSWCIWDNETSSKIYPNA